MSILALDHVQLAMPEGGDADAIHFYQHLLGIPHRPKPPHLAVRGGCWFEQQVNKDANNNNNNNTVKIHLGVDPNFVPAKKAHPALIVQDLGALVQRLQTAKVPVRRDEPLPGYDRVYVEDPFGNRIELMEPTTISQTTKR